jgi:hypothetical protein
MTASVAASELTRTDWALVAAIDTNSKPGRQAAERSLVLLCRTEGKR